MTHKQISQALQRALAKLDKTETLIGEVYMSLADLEATIFMEFVKDPHGPKKAKIDPL